MKYRKLGDSGIDVSEIAFGSWLTTAGGVEKEQAIACVHRALDKGITLIDTANAYGRGIAETVLAEALAGLPRDSYVLATKLYFPMTDNDHGLSRVQIHKQLDASLTRLKVDHVDLYQCHRYDANTPLEETMEALSGVKKGLPIVEGHIARHRIKGVRDDLMRNQAVVRAERRLDKVLYPFEFIHLASRVSS